MASFMLQQDGNVSQFMLWWLSVGRPYKVPEDPVRPGPKSHEFVMFREGQFQVEQVMLYAYAEVPTHRHPNVDTIECHLIGGGKAYVGDKVVAERQARIRIPAGALHGGVATCCNVVLSFQHWLNEVPPTFVTDDWEQVGGGQWI